MKQMSKKLIRLATILTVILTLCLSMTAMAKDVVIVLDPGHGGTEAGATRGSYKEEVINQKIANYLKAELETYAGVKVYMTRTRLNQPAQNREERINIAKMKNADALVSLHINSTMANSQTTSTGAYVCVPSAAKFKSTSAQNARALANSILRALNSYVGVRNNGFWIDDELGIIVFGQKSNYTTAQAAKLGIPKSQLNHKIPSMIVEHCFVNNPNDRRNYLSSDAKLKKFAIGDAMGIASYYNLKKKNSNSSTPVEKPKYTGLVTIDGEKYLFDGMGIPVQGLVKFRGNYYYALEGGKLHGGWKTIGNKRYYFGKTSRRAQTGWQKIGKNKYYFSSKGVAKKKWATIDGVKYYFSKVNGKLLTNYWLKYEGKWYYLNKKGTPYKSCKKKINGKKYKFDANGVCTNKY